MNAPIRAVIADDSPFICRLLSTYLQSSPDVQVVGTALNGLRAVELIKELRPDVVTLDLEMPEMDGLGALEQIMYDCPTPVVMVSGVSRQAARVTLQALDLGAVDFILKYTPGVDIDPEVLRQDIIAKVRAAARIKVIRSLRSAPTVHPEVLPVVTPLPLVSPSVWQPGSVVVIGASTGGPVALRELLMQLPKDFPAAIVIVQHMPPAFTSVLAAQLNRQVALKVKEAAPGDLLQPGLVLVAPGDFHLLVRADGRVELNQGAEIGGHRPSVDVTMQSISQIYGARVKGVLLTGMGGDGALGMVAIHSKGGQTFAQDAESCVINGMPQRAIDKGAVDTIAPPARIAQLLTLAYVRK
jgi:two-component system chemotaxis response regulator CheB